MPHAVRVPVLTILTEKFFQSPNKTERAVTVLYKMGNGDAPRTEYDSTLFPAIVTETVSPVFGTTPVHVPSHPGRDFGVSPDCR